MNKMGGTEQANMLFKVQITEVDPETKEEKRNIFEEEGGCAYYKGLLMIGDHDHESAQTLILNENILRIAAMIAASPKTEMACRMAIMMEDAKHKERDNMAGMFEAALASSLEDGGKDA